MPSPLRPSACAPWAGLHSPEPDDVMSSLLRRAVAFVNTVRDIHLADTGTYARGNHSAPLQGTPGKTSQETVGQNGALVEVSSLHWFFTAAELVLNGQRTVPQRGDRWTVTVGGQQQVWEVYQPDGLSQCYSADATGQQLRVPMKQVT